MMLSIQIESTCMDSTMILKIALMATFFLEVTIFGSFISTLECFKKKVVMDLAMTFSGTLFLSIAMIDIIPEAINNFDSFFQQNHYTSKPESHHQANIPLTMIIAMTTMLVVMFLDKILISQSHDHEYEISFVAQPKRNEDNHSIELKKPGTQEFASDSTDAKKQQKALTDQKKDENINWRPFILQVGMSIHAFFETLALGLQKNTFSVLSLASAILVHKWAEGLTLGLLYKKEGFKTKTVRLMILIQGLVNVFGLLTGSILMGQGHFIMAFFMSMSAGTFLYISLAEVLQEQIKNMTVKKMVVILVANWFIAFIVWLQKAQEAASEHSL